tara:strand:- start:465 stop:1040 length:576 start_codon:yes stop_codon:yes gene_type:complete
MKALEKIKESSQTIVKICQKERLSRADKERLFKLQGDIFSQIDTLTECEICGGVSDLIASITISHTTANLCSQCGIEALTDGQIKKSSRRSSRKTSTNNRTAKNKKVNKTSPLPSKTTNTASLIENIELETGLSKPIIRRIEKMIAEIATPMSVEHTFQYMLNEAKIAKMKVSDEQLEKAVSILMTNTTKS